MQFKEGDIVFVKRPEEGFDPPRHLLNREFIIKTLFEDEDMVGMKDKLMGKYEKIEVKYITK